MRRRHLFKYFSERRWAEAFIEGEMLFRSLSYFRDLEDKGVRSDSNEGVSIFRPEGGLVINNQTQRKTFTLPGHALETIVRQDEILVYCLSRTQDDRLRVAFDAVACVEITDIAAFCERVTVALPTAAQFPGPPGRRRIGQPVTYYEESDDCNPRWALPDVIATSKRQGYGWQEEFRLVFSLTDALAFEKIAARIVPPEQVRPGTRPTEHRRHSLKTASLRDIGRLHLFRPGVRR